MISWRLGMFGLIEKVKWFSAQRKVICKGLTYLLHTESELQTKRISSVFSLSLFAQSFGLSRNNKIDFTFWFNFRSVRISDWAKRLSERLIQKVKSPIVSKTRLPCDKVISRWPAVYSAVLLLYTVSQTSSSAMAERLCNLGDFKKARKRRDWQSLS